MEVKQLNQNEFESFVKEGLVVIDFYADWCGPCKMLAPQLEAAASALNDVKFAKVNVDHNTELAQQFNIQSIPTVLMFKNGKMVGNFMGYIPKDKIIHFVESNK